MCVLSSRIKRLLMLTICVFIFLSNIVLNSQTENNNSQDISTLYLQGERIFFTKHKVEQGIVLGDIYSMDPSGGNVQQLTNFSKDF